MSETVLQTKLFIPPIRSNLVPRPRLIDRLNQGLETAVKLGLAEAEADVDPTFYADVRGEAIWDTAILWTLSAAGVLLLLNNPLWVYFGLVGGGMFLYFAGRGTVARRVMQRRGIRIGIPGALRVAFTFLTFWGLTAVITIIMAVVALPHFLIEVYDG